jgi:hypothetical protein
VLILTWTGLLKRFMKEEMQNSPALKKLPAYKVIFRPPEHANPSLGLGMVSHTYNPSYSEGRD